MARRTSTSWDGTAGPRRSARATRPAGRAGSRGHPSPGGSRQPAELSDGRRAASPCTAPTRGAGGRARAAAAAAAASRREPGGLGPHVLAAWTRSGRAPPAEPASAESAPPRPGPRARPRGPAGDPAPRFREAEEGRGRKRRRPGGRPGALGRRRRAAACRPGLHPSGSRARSHAPRGAVPRREGVRRGASGSEPREPARALRRSRAARPPLHCARAPGGLPRRGLGPGLLPQAAAELLRRVRKFPTARRPGRRLYAGRLLTERGAGSAAARSERGGPAGRPPSRRKRRADFAPRLSGPGVPVLPAGCAR